MLWVSQKFQQFWKKNMQDLIDKFVVTCTSSDVARGAMYVLLHGPVLLYNTRINENPKIGIKISGKNIL